MRGNFITECAYIFKKSKIYQIRNIMVYLKDLEEQEKNKLKMKTNRNNEEQR